MMISKWITFKIQSGRADEFKAELRALEIASSTEDGCLYYRSFQNEGDDSLYFVNETWSNEQSFESHRRAAHTLAFKQKVGALLVYKKAWPLKPLIGEIHETV